MPSRGTMTFSIMTLLRTTFYTFIFFYVFSVEVYPISVEGENKANIIFTETQTQTKTRNQSHSFCIKSLDAL